MAQTAAACTSTAHQRGRSAVAALHPFFGRIAVAHAGNSAAEVGSTSASRCNCRSGRGTYSAAPEYAGDTVSSTTLVRLRYGAKLYRDIKKPVLLSGGMPQGHAISEAMQMKKVLEQEFNIPAQWIEEESANTLESARNSYRLLHQSGIKRIYLVTHAWHMPRSLRAFQAAGFEVIPAPTAFTTRNKADLLAFVPSAGALQDSQIFLHEAIGMLWYRLKS